MPGTLASLLGTGAKGVASGVIAVGTEGISVVAKGLVDRVVALFPDGRCTFEE